jgi:hypothetical protein
VAEICTRARARDETAPLSYAALRKKPMHAVLTSAMQL